MSNSKKKQLLTLAVVTALMNTGYGLAHAEEAPAEEAQAVEVQAAESAQQVQTRDVVVTASRTEQLIKDTPAAVEVITAEDIKNMGAESVAQALQKAAGIDILANGMVGNKTSIRGMSSNQTLIMIDGRRVRTEDTDQTANFYELQRFNIDDIERVEIVRGATSSLYGADAMGGVINIITKSTKKESASISGDWTSKQSDAGFNMTTGSIGKWSFGLNYKYSRYRNITENTSDSSSATIPNLESYANYQKFIEHGYKIMGDSEGADFKGMANYSKKSDKSSSSMFGHKQYVNFKANYDIDEKKSLEFFYDYMKEDLKDLSTNYTVYSFTSLFPSVTDIYTPLHSVMGGLTSPASSFTINENVSTHYDNTRTSAGLTYKGKDKKGDYQIRYYYAQLDKDQQSYTNGSLSDFDKMTFTQNVVDGQRNYQLSDKHLLTYGAEYRSEEYEGTRTGLGGSIGSFSYGGLTKSGSDTHLYYSAAYIQDQWMPNEQWIVIPSLRIDHNNVYGNKITYKVGTTFIQNDNLRWKFNIGTAYRAPSASELFMDMTHKPVAGISVHVQGNPNLRPESSVNTDFGFEWGKDKTKVKATWFMNKVSNLIGSFDDGTSDEANNIYNQVYQNVDRATIMGVELDATQSFSKNWDFRTVYTYLDAKDDSTSAFLTGRARHKASFQLNYMNNDKDLTSSLWYDWYGDYLQTATSKSSGGLLNFVVTKDVAKNATVYFGINNILDSQNDVLNYDGRVWRAGFNIKF